MNERAIMIGGALKITSAKDKGTVVEITVPVIHKTGDEKVKK
ncbi:MAG TPA: hypothetical protein PLL71_14230 [Agriterribacter sp.]|nr:hypothetical protein [Agriterribacter sp.]